LSFRKTTSIYKASVSNFEKESANMLSAIRKMRAGDRKILEGYVMISVGEFYRV